MRAVVELDDMTDTSIKDFEAAIAELETIVKKLEEGDLPLEQSLALYERGVQLSRFCHARLEEAERRIEILNERGELKPAPASLRRRRSRARLIAAVTAEPLADVSRTARASGSTRRSSATCRAPPACPPIVSEAMRYSVFAGGKRLRPILALAAADAVARRRARSGATARDARAARRVRHRADSHLLADSRRSAGDGQRHAAPRPADAARRLRRRHRDSRRRRAAGRSVRAARARAGDRRPGDRRAQAARRRRSSARPRARAAWSAARRSICRPPGRRPATRSRSTPTACARCTRARPAR